MLRDFTVKNFRSILNLKLDLAFAEGKAPNGYKQSPLHIFYPKGNERITPCLAVFGANASGKTNFIRAFSNLCSALTNRVGDIFCPNLLHPGADPTEYDISFYLEDDIYSYSIKFTDKCVVSERFAVNDKVYFDIFYNNLKFNSLSYEQYPDAKLKEILKVECSWKKEPQNVQDRSFLGILANKYSGLNEEVNKAFNYMKSLFVFFPGTLPNIETLLEWADKISKKYEKKLLLRETAMLLRKFDFDVEELVYKEKSFSSKEEIFDYVLSNPNRIKNISNYNDRIAREKYVIHKNKNGDYIEFELNEESSGTQTLAQLIMLMLLAMENGAPLLIDEIDRAIHPFILNCILNIFKDKSYNGHCSQLIFTTHTTDILENENIRISEIGLIDKTKKSGTTLKRASDIEGVRNVHNFRKLYCSGKLTAIPFPYI